MNNVFFNVKTFYQSQGSSAATVRKLRTKFGRNEAPTSWTVRRLVRKFEKTGSVDHVSRETIRANSHSTL